MFCSQCGSQIPDDAVFCPECGERTDVEFVEEQAYSPEQNNQAAEMPTQEPEMSAPKPPKVKDPNKKSFPKILIAVIAIVAVVMMFCAAAVVMLFTKKDYDVTSDKMLFINFYDDQAFTLNGDIVELSDVVCEQRMNADGSVSAYTSDDEERILYCIKDMKETKIAEDVSGFVVSYTGDVIAYVVTDRYESVGTLYLYSVKDNESSKIAEDVYASGMVLSPEGKKVAYIGDYEDLDDNRLYVSGKNGKAEKIEKDGSYCIGLNDKGNAIYYIKNDKLYIRKGNEEQKISSDISSKSFYFNKNMTELLYTKNDKTCLYTLGKEDSVKLSSGIIREVFMPNDAAIYYSNLTDYAYAQVIGKKSFANTLINIGYDTYWINRKADGCVEMTYYDNASGGVQVNRRYTEALYRDLHNLYRVERLNNNMKTEDISQNESMENFAASGDLKKVYIVNDDDELLYLKNPRKTVLISNDITDNQVVYSDALDAVVYVEDGELYYAKTTQNSAKLIETDEDVWGLSSVRGIIIFNTQEDGKTVLYVLDNKGKAQRISD